MLDGGLFFRCRAGGVGCWCCPRNASASSGVSNRKLRVKEPVISVVFFGPLFQTLKCISFDPFCQFDRVKSSAGLGVAGLFRRAEKSGFGRCVGCRGFRSMLTFGRVARLRMDAVARRKDRFARIFLSRSVGFRNQLDCGANVFLGQPPHVADESGFDKVIVQHAENLIGKRRDGMMQVSVVFLGNCRRKRILGRCAVLRDFLCRSSRSGKVPCA